MDALFFPGRCATTFWSLCASSRLIGSVGMFPFFGILGLAHDGLAYKLDVKALVSGMNRGSVATWWSLVFKCLLTYR